MRNSRTLSITLFAVLFIGVFPTTAHSAQKVTPGAACKVFKKKITYQSKTYSCIKSGKKLIWNSGSVIKTSSNTPAKKPQNTNAVYENNSYLEPSMKSQPLDKCRIKENSDQGSLRGDLASGFPFIPKPPHQKDIKMALVPIDFSDLPGQANFKSRVDTQMQMMSDWYSEVSGGRINISWTLASDWVRLPGASKDYTVPFSGSYPATSDFWTKVIPIVDSKIDLTGIQTINFLLPSGQEIIAESVQSFPFLNEMKVSNSSKTKLISFSTAGVYFDSPVRTYWSYWAHEFGHTLGIAHVGTSRGSSQVINGYDLMGNQDGPYRELSGWLRFLAGWLDDSQVYCQDVDNLASNEVSLVPLSDSKSGIKMVVIPTATDSAIVIESRRPTKFSCEAPNLPGGVLVYTYDAKLGNQSYFITAQYPSDRAKFIRCPGNEGMELYPDALLHKADSITVGNIQISVTSSGNFDQIKIIKQ